jgi:hypothetical protein
VSIESGDTLNKVPYEYATRFVIPTTATAQDYPVVIIKRGDRWVAEQTVGGWNTHCLSHDGFWRYKVGTTFASAFGAYFLARTTSRKPYDTLPAETADN